MTEKFLHHIQYIYMQKNPKQTNFCCCFSSQKSLSWMYIITKSYLYVLSPFLCSTLTKHNWHMIVQCVHVCLFLNLPNIHVVAYLFCFVCSKDAVSISGNQHCPVRSFEKYLAKLHKDNNFLWQRPKKFENDQYDPPTWYDNMVVSKNA